MAESPDKNSSGVITATVYVKNKAVKSDFSLIRIHVKKEINRIGSATVVFRAGNISKQNIPESESDVFELGNSIRIEAGYNSDESIVFEGLIINHEVDIKRGESPQLIIECRDYAFPATLSRKNRVFSAKADNDALALIWKDYKPTARIDKADVKFPELVQYYCSDWDFTLSRADANGWVVFTEGDKITIGKPAVDQSPVLSLTYGCNVIDFNASLDAENQVGTVKACAWDSTTQKLKTVTAEEPEVNDQGVDSPANWVQLLGLKTYELQTTSVAEEGNLQAWADAKRLRTALGRIRGTISFQGNPAVTLGSVVEVDGVGNRFNGDIYVGSIEHEIKKGNWLTTVGIGIPPENITEKSDVISPAASGLIPGIHGLHIGKVSKLEEDPLAEFRIQVEIPLLNGQANTIWARMAHGWAGSGSGFFFLPDIGDEVVLGFFNDDPCHGVILGSLYSSKHKSPYNYKDDNNIRAIYTRSGMKIEFEEESKVITIETPGSNKILLDDENETIQLLDQYENKIIMNSSGIMLDSAQDIVLKATENIKLESGAKTSIEATGNLDMEGKNVGIKANVEFKAQGSSTAELTATGNTVIKGTMVKIN